MRSVQCAACEIIVCGCVLMKLITKIISKVWRLSSVDEISLNSLLNTQLTNTLYFQMFFSLRGDAAGSWEHWKHGTTPIRDKTIVIGNREDKLMIIKLKLLWIVEFIVYSVSLQTLYTTCLPMNYTPHQMVHGISSQFFSLPHQVDVPLIRWFLSIFSSRIHIDLARAYKWVIKFVQSYR